MGNKSSDSDTQDEMMRGIGVGIALGTAAGIHMDNLPMWMALGVAFGIALGAGLDRRKHASN